MQDALDGEVGRDIVPLLADPLELLLIASYHNWDSYDDPVPGSISKAMPPAADQERSRTAAARTAARLRGSRSTIASASAFFPRRAASAARYA